MPQYRVLQTSFINNAIVQEGAVIDYDGEAGPNLELIKGKKGKAAAEPVDAGGEQAPASGDGDLV